MGIVRDDPPLIKEAAIKVLVTGGAGYIGSTICSALEDSGHTPIIIDSLVTGRKEFLHGRTFYQEDIGNIAAIECIFREHPDIFATIHCAALIVVPESTARPFEYYRENVAKSNELFYTLQRLGCKRVVFSSSASVYANVPDYVVTEEAPLNPISPYARTKFMMEMVLKDFCAAYPMKGIALRYFNPIGADPKMRSGLSLEVPSLLVGRLVETALGKLPFFEITGTDYATRDGTGLRDYIHVWDLALAHVKAVENFDNVFQRAGGDSNYLVINLGNGRGVTVREMVTAFEKVWGKPINKHDAPARPGDVPGAYASNERAKTLLGWQPQLSIEQGISDALKWGELRQTILGFGKK